jgi:hypothetical protein
VGGVGLAQEPIAHGISELVLLVLLLLLLLLHCSGRLSRRVADRDRHRRHLVPASLHLDYPRREMRPPYFLPRCALTVHKPPHRWAALAIQHRA